MSSFDMSFVIFWFLNWFYNPNTQTKFYWNKWNQTKTTENLTQNEWASLVAKQDFGWHLHSFSYNQKQKYKNWNVNMD